jgi:Domain of unknown function (DUF4331)
MSSHREAPGTSQDPVADSTDVYAFVSPDDPTTVTLICNYIPLEGPAAGPNFYEFGDDVLYSLNISNQGTAQADITYDFQFQTEIVDPNTFLYNTGPISGLTDPHFNKRQTYTVTRTAGFESTVLGTGLASPPCNIGPLSTPNYPALAAEAVHSLPGGRTVFAGQRAEGFYVDLGAVFDLGDLRPFEQLHAFGSLPSRSGVNATAQVNVHTIALKVPISDLLAGPGFTLPFLHGQPPATPSPVIGVWATASRSKVALRGTPNIETGPWVQVSRLGNPLFNEVLVPLGQKDQWNASNPSGDSYYAGGVAHPELAGLLNVLYPGVFPNLAAYAKPRADLLAILLTGIPAGVVSPTYTTYTGSTQADMLRLNTSIKPTTRSPNVLGVLGGDLAGFPNGRRVFDDVFTIELRAIAGVTIPLVDPTFTPDGAAAVVTDGLTFDNYLPTFPYLGVPYSGYDVPSS